MKMYKIVWETMRKGNNHTQAAFSAMEEQQRMLSLYGEMSDRRKFKVTEIDIDCIPIGPEEAVSLEHAVGCCQECSVPLTVDDDCHIVDSGYYCHLCYLDYVGD